VGLPIRFCVSGTAGAILASLSYICIKLREPVMADKFFYFRQSVDQIILGVEFPEKLLSDLSNELDKAP
jgi:hypothetical protein